MSKVIELVPKFYERLAIDFTDVGKRSSYRIFLPAL